MEQMRKTNMSFSLIKHLFKCWLARTWYSWRGVTIGRRTFISRTAKIDTAKGKIVIGDRCTITHGCVILSHDYSGLRFGRKVEFKTVIGNRVFIGVNAVVLPGVTIGDDVVVGAGTVVTGDVPANSIIAGNPGKIIRTFSVEELFYD